MAGLVNRTSAGSASLLSLNREHLAAGPVEALASVRAQLWKRIAEHADDWTLVPDGLVVDGSAARGDGDASSDIDLLVLGPPAVSDDDEEWHRDLTDLADQVTRWTGNPCEVLDRSADELRSMAAAGERLLAEIRDGRALVGAISLVPARRLPEMGAQNDADSHLRKAREFVDAASMELEMEFHTATASSAVLAGINAKDAICLRLTRRTGKSEDHRAAVPELTAAGPVGRAAVIRVPFS